MTRARVARVLQTLRSAAMLYDASFVAVARRALHVRLRRGFRLAEASSLRLLDPRLGKPELQAVVSRAELRPVQRRLNPRQLEQLTEDKVVFYRLCERMALPTPALHAVVYRDEPGWTRDGSRPQTGDEWAAALERVLPDEFVVKPSRGHFGLGVRAYELRDGAAVDPGGAAPLPVLVERLREHPRYRSWVFQERLRSHPLLESLSGSRTLQTVRVITLLGAESRARILHAELKVVMGGALVDNIHDGATGNGVCTVALDTGRLDTVVAPHPDGTGPMRVEAHPCTGVVFADQVLPFWPAAVNLVERAAEAFAPIRTLGWDVALTADGPVIVETNMWWGPPNELGVMREIFEALVA